MQAGRWAGTVRERRAENVDAFWREEVVYVADAGGVGAVAVTDEQGFRVEPEDVAGLAGAGRVNRSEDWNILPCIERAVMSGFGDAVGFSGTHEDHAEVGGERGVVGVDSVEGEPVCVGQFDDFRAGGLQFAA